MSNLRERVLAWITEQERVCAEATPGPWIESHYRVFSDPLPGHVAFTQVCFTAHNNATRTERAMRDGTFIATTRTGYPLVLAALRAEVQRHVTVPGEEGCQFCEAYGENELPCCSMRSIAEKLGIKA